ncbi:hypothetical protein BPY_00170 [Bifidobacterium psychraerophilum]|jgi:maltodextrin utilization protein YvdJ|uniref:hypothetical protein n=1 Tax=Bifidobacterium psychraerophilum TaxID=218140 RepID=UPI0031183BB5
MFAFMIVLLVVWLIAGAIGLVVQGMLWLFWVALALFVLTAVAGFIKGLFRKNPTERKP